MATSVTKGVAMDLLYIISMHDDADIYLSITDSCSHIFGHVLTSPCMGHEDRVFVGQISLGPDTGGSAPTPPQLIRTAN